MTPSHGSDPEVGLLRMLRVALKAGLEPDADEEAFTGARSAAQIIGLAGLEAGLDALEPHRGRPWSGAARALVEFLERRVAESDLRGVRAADAEIEALAAAVRAARPAATEPRAGASAQGAGDEAAPPPGSVTAAEALGELPLSGDLGTDRASRTWITPHTAAALRAALEWLAGDVERPRPVRLRAEDSLLEATCEQVSPEGLAPAHEVLAAAGGNLVPVAEVGARAVAGAWLVRVPAWSPRPVHLMIEQGDLRLALPWHAVLRLLLVPSIEIEMRGGSLATPVLEPLAPLETGLGERPVVAIAHGVKRALLVADRLVWRLGAEPCEPVGEPPVPGLTAAVRSDEGEVFWVADPAVLLGAVPMPSLPAPAGPRPSTAPPRGVAPAPSPAKPAPASATPVRPGPPRGVPPVEAPIELTAESVEPLELTLADVEPLERPAAVAASAVPDLPVEQAPPAVPSPRDAAPAPAEPRALPDWLERFGTTGGPGRPAPTTAAPSLPRPAAPGVLIAEDSIAARLFLTRLLERRGLAVTAVETAAALREALPQRAWSLVCVDVELPDAAGTSVLEELRGTPSLAEVPLVALVRDDDDAERAAGAGVRRWLRKPFDGEEVDHLLARLGLAGGVRS